MQRLNNLLIQTQSQVTQLESQVWQEKNSKKPLEHDIADLRQQIRELTSQNSELKNTNIELHHAQDKASKDEQRRLEAETEWDKQLRINSDLRSQSEDYARRVLDLELQVDKKRGELSQT